MGGKLLGFCSRARVETPAHISFFSLRREIGGIDLHGIDIVVTSSLSLSGHELQLSQLRSTLHLSPLLDRPQSWISRYSSKWGSQGTMALPKNANAVIHPSFGKIQT